MNAGGAMGKRALAMFAAVLLVPAAGGCGKPGGEKKKGPVKARSGALEKEPARTPATEAPRPAAVPRPAPKAFDSPREAWLAHKACMKSEDWGGVWDLLSKEGREEVMEDLKPLAEAWRKGAPGTVEPDTGKTYGELQAMGWKEVWIVGMTAASKQLLENLRPESWKFDKEWVDGEQGEVAYRNHEGDRRSFEFVKEGGGWKLNGVKHLPCQRE
jgi:hypothetical protein